MIENFINQLIESFIQILIKIEDGIQFDQEPKDQSWLWREAKLKDLDGNQLILFFGGENRLNPPWKIKND